jgi:hypothetical protein
MCRRRVLDGPGGSGSLERPGKPQIDACDHPATGLRTDGYLGVPAVKLFALTDEQDIRKVAESG